MVFYRFIQILIEPSESYSGKHEKTPYFAASDLVLHCLPMSHKKDARLVWVNALRPNYPYDSLLITQQN